jgi:hypothetical protein
MPKDEDYFLQAKSTDFIEYGFESEFVGRLPVVVSCHELGVEDLFQILKNSEGSIMHQYKNAFEAYGIDLTHSDSGLYRIAQKAYEERTGARSLVGVCERTFREYKYQLPHSAIKSLELTERLVDNPNEVLNEILQVSKATQLKEMDAELDGIAKEWSQKHEIPVNLNSEAARLLSSRAYESGVTLKDTFVELFKDFEDGLNLIRGAQAIQFEITEEVVHDPKTALDKWIRAYYACCKQ